MPRTVMRRAARRADCEANRLWGEPGVGAAAGQRSSGRPRRSGEPPRGSNLAVGEPAILLAPSLHLY